MNRTAASLLFAIAFALALAPSLGCGKRVGGACRESARICTSKTTALFCAGGKLAEMSCRGPLGCVGGDPAFCDSHVAQEHDGCDPRTNNLACTMDKKAELRCQDYAFVVATSCRGAKGCAIEGTDLACDTDLAASNDPCEDEDALSCGVDGKALFRCKKGRYVIEGSCRGPGGCSVASTKLRCDDRQADVGDACRVEGNFACSFDGRSLLACQDGKFKNDRACKKPCTSSDVGDRLSFDCR